ncbi:MAG: iron-containing alcohol dehydrogenase [Silvibacterium sp.]
MHSFEFATARRVLFGSGESARLGEMANLFAMRRCLVVTGSSPDRVSSIVEPLKASGIALFSHSFQGEPTVEVVRQGVAQARERGCDGVIAIGGGSVLDAGKAIASLLRNEGDVLDYLEVIGKGRQLEEPSAPWIALPTTAGTGAEVTKNAVLFSPKDRVKVSLRSPWMLPAVAIVDPDLTKGLPRKQTIWSAMDALTQLIEPYVSCRANVIVDGFCLQGMPLVAGALEKMTKGDPDAAMRADMAMGSLLSGMSLANAGLGVVHGFAGPLGGMFDAPHGAICAALLPHGMEANIAFLRRAETAKAGSVVASLERFATVARRLTGRPAASPEDGVAYVKTLARDLEVQPLSSFGMTAAEAEEVVAKAQKASSMKANTVVLSAEELTQVYRNAL